MPDGIGSVPLNGSIQDARNYLRTFFDWYNHEHYHSGIAMLPPAAVHYGTDKQIIEKRTNTMKTDFEKYPERFVKGKAVSKTVSTESWINQPCKTTMKVA